MKKETLNPEQLTAAFLEAAGNNYKIAAGAQSLYNADTMTIAEAVERVRVMQGLACVSITPNRARGPI